MKNDSLIIMAGGASSRMKKSLSKTNLKADIVQAAKDHHKSLIPLDDKGRPLLYFLLKNALNSGIRTVYLITAQDNSAFKDFISRMRQEHEIDGLEIKFAIQHIPQGSKKPLGTADALQQCLEQHRTLLEEHFTVCNGDNLYSTDAFSILRNTRVAPNALIAYEGLGLGHSEEKIAKFALLDFDEDLRLTHIVEKPNTEVLGEYKNKHDKLWVSMNIFNLQGAIMYPFLVDCPMHPERGEKELPEAIRNMIKDPNNSILCIPRSEKIPDLTSAEDIGTFNP